MKSSTDPSVPPGLAGPAPTAGAAPAPGSPAEAAARLRPQAEAGEPSRSGTGRADSPAGPGAPFPNGAAGVPSPDGATGMPSTGGTTGAPSPNGATAVPAPDGAGPVLAAAAPDPVPFWRAKPLDAMTDAEWESLCDGCGRCCLNKLEEEETGDIFWTDVACRLLDPVSCRCSSYPNRHDFVPDCVRLDVHEVVHQTYTWLPPTCAYRRLAAGRDLAWWHPLVSGDPATVHAAGISVRNRTVSERTLDPDDVEALEARIVDWPGEDPDPRPPRRRPARR